jgi:hypothetical protein
MQQKLWISQKDRNEWKVLPEAEKGYIIENGRQRGR